jgi:ribosomal protein S18 acetylase RimI-like enzyme
VPLEFRAGDERDWSRFEELVAMSPEAAGWVDLYPSLVAERDGVIVGFALYRLVAGEGELLNLAVDPKARRGGVGSALLTHMMGLAELWHLEVRESNAAAIALYQAAGFSQVGRRAEYYSDGEAALLFSGSRRTS